MRLHVPLALILLAASLPAQKTKKTPPPAAPVVVAQQNDAAYTAEILKDTTEKFFLTELVDHLPASATVPTPQKVLGYIAGAPNKLTYSKDIYKYMNELEKSSKRVKIFSIGKTEEGRDTMLVAVSDEALADPRKTDDKKAAELIANEALPFYWASGSIHSPETGSPEMLMELAYRLAVEDSPLIRNIRAARSFPTSLGRIWFIGGNMWRMTIIATSRMKRICWFGGASGGDRLAEGEGAGADVREQADVAE